MTAALAMDSGPRTGGHGPDWYCGAPKRQGEGTCEKRAGWGTKHVGIGRCKNHGGSTPSHVKNAVEVQARAELARLNVAPVTDPLTALGQIAGEVLAWKDAMAEKVNELKSLRYSTENGGEQLRAEVALYTSALDRCERFLSSMARLDIDERLARVTIAQKLMIVRAVEAALASAGVAGPAAAEAKRVAARHLREMA